MEVTKEQSMAYTEVLEVLKNIPEADLNKIPKEKIKYFEDNMDKDYDFKINYDKTFEEQVLLEKTKLVLAILFRDYWATEEQREKIQAKEKYDLNVLEEQKKEKYNPDDIFKDTKQFEIDEAEVVSEKKQTESLVEYKKENWYQKFIEFFKKIFKITNK